MKSNKTACIEIAAVLLPDNLRPAATINDSISKLGLEGLEWGGHIAVEGYGSFELLQEDRELPRSIISDGENLLYVDFGAMDGNIVEASIDLGADGALDAIWAINLNDSGSDDAGLVLLDDYSSVFR